MKFIRRLVLFNAPFSKKLRYYTINVLYEQLKFRTLIVNSFDQTSVLGSVFLISFSTSSFDVPIFKHLDFIFQFQHLFSSLIIMMSFFRSIQNIFDTCCWHLGFGFKLQPQTRKVPLSRLHVKRKSICPKEIVSTVYRPVSSTTVC